jgi:hypothetical protein
MLVAAKTTTNKKSPCAAARPQPSAASAESAASSTLGLVQSLAHPGGNVTGNTILGAALAAKRLQLFKEAVPAASRVASSGTRIMPPMC